MERLSKPFTALPCEGLSVMNVSPNSMSHFGVMRRAISEESSVSRVPPLSGVTMLETVGSENSSATNGSSVESVAGKNRAPAKPWPNARLVTPSSHTAQTSQKSKVKYFMKIPQCDEKTPALRRDGSPGCEREDCGACTRTAQPTQPRTN